MGAAESASNEIIYYLPEYVSALGMTVHMQTLYMSWLTCIIVILIVTIATSGAKMVPGRLQAFFEMLFDWLGGLMEDNMGKEGRRVMTPFIITLFLYIFIANEVGLLPQVGGHLIHFTSPTNDINVAFGLSLMVTAVTYLVGISRNGFGHFGHFVKPYAAFLPLNIVEEIAKPVTMALRLFGNILAGEILLIVLYMLTPWVIPDVWVLFSLCVGVLQAFIFSMLTIIALAPIFKGGH